MCALFAQTRVDRMFAAFAARGFMPRVVRLVTATNSGSSALGGDPGTANAPSYAVISNALADLRTQYRTEKGMLLPIGDGKIVFPADAVTPAAILAAAWLEVDAVRYTIVTGEVKQETFITSIVVKKEL